MALKKSKIGPKSRKKRSLDAEDRRALLEKKALKKQKKLEFGVKLAETHQVKKAIAAARTVAIDDVMRAINSKSTRSSSRDSRTPSQVSVSSLLSSIGVQRTVDNLDWSSDDNVSDDSDTESDSSTVSETHNDDPLLPNDSSEGESQSDISENEDDVDSHDSEETNPAAVGFHKRVSFPADVSFTSESQELLSELVNGKKNIVVCSEKFHDLEVARSCYLGLTAHMVSHILTKTSRVEKNNQKLKKLENPEIAIDSLFRDQGSNRARICVLCPFRSNCFEIVRNILTLLELSPEDVGNGESFFQEYEGQDERNTHAKNWEDWRRELFKGHYDDNNYDDFIVGVTFGYGKVKIFFPKTADKLCHMDLIIASPLALSRVAAEDHKTVRKHQKQKTEAQDLEDENRGYQVDNDSDDQDEPPVPMDFLSSLELLIIDRVDALYMQNWDNLIDVVSAANQKPVATISANIDRIESKFLESTSADLRQTILMCGSTWSEKFSQLFTCTDDLVVAGTRQDWSGAPLNKALKHGIKQQFFINVENVLDHFKTKYWKDIGGDEIRSLIIVVSRDHDYEAVRDFLENHELITDCYLTESEVSSHRRKLKEILKNFKSGCSRIIVVSERLLWYQRIRILTGAHVVFFGVPVTDTVYSDTLCDIADAGRCTSVCLHTPEEMVVRERIVGTRNQPTDNIPGKVVVFTSNN